MSALSVMLLNAFGCMFANKRAARLYPEAQGKTFDAIIVPGVPFNGSSWDSTMKARVLWSYHLYKNGIARNVIYSGGAVYTPYYEAKIMGLYGQQLGIPASHIFYDTLAEHSTENVFYSYEIARRQGFKTIALATDPGQSSLLGSFTKKRFGTNIVHIPFLADTLKTYNHLNPVIDPASAEAPLPFVPLPSRESTWRRMMGTIGKNVPWPDERKRSDSL